ncbi:MAG: hypothetical protein HKN13_10855 [Rhodothermales bacterium]|nr:hypothetical protein [Rhodothermales bacterium]
MIKVTTPNGHWQAFCDLVRQFLEADIVELSIEGEAVRGYRSPDSPALWIRDHSDILRAGRYFDSTTRSTVDAFAETQSRSGRIFDYVLNKPATWAGEQENWEKWVRIPVEADVEYRFVKAAFIEWQSSGDDEWLASILPALDRALHYATTHQLRLDPSSGLVKRAYTMDTWDFDYTAGRHPWLNFQITDDTFWGIMHGDNSGVFESARLLERMYAYLGDEHRAGHWKAEADRIARAANHLLFNGRFYNHFHKLTDVVVEGVDESEQLSLSNPMAITRGMATPEIASAILTEYQSRRESSEAFAEWFSIDPPFPDGFFGDEKLVAGAYINGGIMPLVGGELALAAFESGFETYGLQTLEQYREMVAESGETFLWYFPDGTPSSVDTSTSPEAMPTDGWGSSAMLNALVRGLCGIVDTGSCYSSVTLAPRWLIAGEDVASVEVSYAASAVGIAYDFRHNATDSTVDLDVRTTASSTALTLRLLVPQDRQPERLTVDSEPKVFSIESVGTSTYAVVDFTLSDRSSVKLIYR